MSSQFCSCSAIGEQLNELQLINSMYPNQVTVSDRSLEAVLAGDEDAVSECIAIHEHPVEFCFLSLANKAEIYFTLPEKYPHSAPLNAFVRLTDSELSSAQSKQLQCELNERIARHIASANAHFVDVFSVIKLIEDWQSEEKPRNTHSTNASVASKADEKRPNLSRIWIFSHHIYSNTKRKDIVDRAKQLSLSGFSRPGKPGFICVEGQKSDCEEFWQEIRSWSWQKIALIASEDSLEKRLFVDFRELVSDNSAFIKFLDENNCSQIIKHYLGF